MKILTFPTYESVYLIDYGTNVIFTYLLEWIQLSFLSYDNLGFLAMSIIRLKLGLTFFELA